MQYRIVHSTRYEYPESVSQCVNMAFMLPRTTNRQTCQNASLRVDPLPVTASERTDYFGNRAFHFSIEKAHQFLEVTAESLVDVRTDEFLPVLDLGSSCQEAQAVLETSREPDMLLAREYMLNSPLVSVSGALRDYAAPSFEPQRPWCLRFGS